MSDSNTIKPVIYETIKTILEDSSLTITDDMPLIGDSSRLDSMKLVELCLALEDKAAEMAFEFDWTSDAAMSKSQSIFRNAGALANEFLSQMQAQK